MYTTFLTGEVHLASILITYFFPISCISSNVNVNYFLRFFVHFINLFQKLNKFVRSCISSYFVKYTVMISD